MENTGKPTELGVKQISKLLLAYSLPAIAAQMASSIYNVVDSIFIGRGVNPMALTGLGITLPLMNLAAAFGAMVGAGGATLVSIKLGQKDRDGANRVLGNVAALNIILGVAVMIVGLVFINPILLLFGASEATLPYAKEFMQVVLYGNVITHLYFGLVSVVRSAGFPKKAMYATLQTVAVNVALAPLFIFVFNWGLTGAALATVLAQLSSLIVLIVHFADKKKYLHFIKANFRPQLDTIKGIFSIGMSPFMMNICSCLVVIIINNKLKEYGGDYAIGAYSNVNKVLMLFAMLVMGFNMGMQPIAGYNFGAKLYSRVTEVFKLTVRYATIVMTTAFVVCELFPDVVSWIFTDDAQMISMSAFGMRIAVAAFPVVGFQMVTSTFFQSIGKAFMAVILSTTRQMLFLVPMLLVLPSFFGLAGVWICMPISDALSSILAGIVLSNQLKKFNSLAAKTS